MSSLINPVIFTGLRIKPSRDRCIINELQAALSRRPTSPEVRTPRKKESDPSAADTFIPDKGKKLRQKTTPEMKRGFRIQGGKLWHVGKQVSFGRKRLNWADKIEPGVEIRRLLQFSQKNIKNSPAVAGGSTSESWFPASLKETQGFISARVGASGLFEVLTPTLGLATAAASWVTRTTKLIRPEQLCQRF